MCVPFCPGDLGRVEERSEFRFHWYREPLALRRTRRELARPKSGAISLDSCNKFPFGTRRVAELTLVDSAERLILLTVSPRSPKLRYNSARSKGTIFHASTPAESRWPSYCTAITPCTWQSTRYTPLFDRPRRTTVHN